MALHLGNPTGGEADDDNTASIGECSQRGVEDIAADRIKNDVDTAIVRKGEDLLP